MLKSWCVVIYMLPCREKGNLVLLSFIGPDKRGENKLHHSQNLIISHNISHLTLKWFKP